MKKNISTLIGLSQKAKYSVLFLALLAASPFANAQTKNSTVTVDGKTFNDFNKNRKLDVWEDTRLSVDKRIDAIIKQMTNEEKVNLLIGTGMPGIEVLTGPVGDSKQGLVPGAAGGTDSSTDLGFRRRLLPMDHASAKNFPRVPADNPKEVTYEGVYVGYRYFNTFNVKPSYEFGFGKSYTDFAYSNLKLNSKNFNNKLEVTVEVKNTGKVAGKEVVELYLSAPNQSIDKPKSELKAYAKTKDLKPGESQTITLTLNPKDLASYISSKSAWVAEAGNYKVSVGASSLDIKQTADFSLPKELVVEKVQHVCPADKQFEDLRPSK